MLLVLALVVLVLAAVDTLLITCCSCTRSCVCALAALVGASTTSCCAASGALPCVRLGRGSRVAEFGLVLLRRRFVLVLVLAELGMGSRFGALRAVAPRGYAGGERRGEE